MFVFEVFCLFLFWSLNNFNKKKTRLLVVLYLVFILQLHSEVSLQVFFQIHHDQSDIVNVVMFIFHCFFSQQLGKCFTLSKALDQLYHFTLIYLLKTH